MPDATLSNDYDVFVVGGGPAGLSAGIYAARAGMRAVLAEMSAPGGQIALSDQIENYPGIERAAGYELGDTLMNHAVAAGCTVLYDEATAIRPKEDGLFEVTVGSNAYRVPAVVYAAGATPRRAGFAGEEAFTGRGVSYCATCDGMFYRGKDVFVVGGGTSACEEALFLSRIAESVTLVVRRDVLRTVPRVKDEIEAATNIVVRYGTLIDRVEGSRALGTVVLRDAVSGSCEERVYDEGHVGVFVFVGHDPRTALVRDLVDLSEDRSIKTDAYLATKTPGLFAAGDVRETVLRQVVTAAADGAVAAMSAYHYVASGVRR